MWGEFKAFLTKTNALALAIGVIIRVAAALKIVLQPAVNGDPATEVAIRRGLFLDAVISFVVVALVVFLIGRSFIREAPAAPAEPSDEVKLLTEIRDELR